MKPSTKNRAEGKVLELKGKMKEAAGKATNNPRLEDEGTVDKVAGKVKKKVGEIGKVFGQ